MQLRSLFIAGAVAAMGMVAANGVFAAPYVVLEEGGPSSPNPNVPGGPGNADVTISDFPTNPSTYSFDLDVLGDTSFYGGVAHANGSSSNWVDSWTVDFGSKFYNIVFDWEPFNNNPFDGSFLNILTDPDTVLTTFSGAGGSTWVAALTGVVEFQVNPILPDENGPRELGYWAVHATAVPLPTGGLLLLGALGGLALFRSRKSA